MKNYFLIVALPLLLMSHLALASDLGSTMLKCQLKAPKQAKLGQAVELNFKLTNISDKPLWVLKWNTPLEGWFNRSFNVTRDGYSVNYIGAMVKRWKPSDEDYSELLPGQSIENVVDLAEGYEIKVAGVYQFVFNGRLQDVQQLAKGERLSKHRKLHQVNCDDVTIDVTL